jgi:hypothetical protein
VTRQKRQHFRCGIPTRTAAVTNAVAKSSDTGLGGIDNLILHPAGLYLTTFDLPKIMALKNLLPSGFNSWILAQRHTHLLSANSSF